MATPVPWSPRPTTCELFADQIRPFVAQRYKVLGTDGFGRSDYAQALRRFFEVDRHYVARRGVEGAGRRRHDPAGDSDARRSSKYGIDPDKPIPRTV